MADFDAREYWERRLEESYAIDGVGFEGLGTAFNEWMYRVRREVFLRTARPLVSTPAAARILDIGSGTGFYVERWHEIGVPSVVGADLTQTAVEQLARHFPRDRFVQMDVGDPRSPLDGERFDAISAMDVLFHIVDDERFAQAFRTVHSLLAPGGVFLFSDNFLRHDEAVRARHQTSRTLAEITALVQDAGLEVVGRRPMFVLLNTPVDSRSPILRASWQLLSSVALRSNTAAGLLGGLLYPLEVALVGRLREGPSTELMVCRRLPDGGHERSS